MPYDNDALATTQIEYTAGTGPFSYASIALIAGIPHEEQLEVEFEFTVDGDDNDLSDLPLTMEDKKVMFTLPPAKLTFNEGAKTITVTADLSDLTYSAEDGETEVQYPDISLGTTGQLLRIRRKTVSNEKFVNFVIGAIDAHRLNHGNNQFISLLQEILSDLRHNVLRQSDLDTVDGPMTFENFTVPPIALDDLSDVYCPTKTNGYVVKWVEANNRFELSPDLTADTGGELVAPGGIANDVLIKQSGVDGDVIWISLNDHPSFESLVDDVTTLGTTISGKVSKSGDIMTGPLFLSADPTTSSQAATKNYVDSTVVASSVPTRNFLMNPKFVWNQRGTTGGPGAITSQGAFDADCMRYGPDRWGIFFSNTHGSAGTRTISIASSLYWEDPENIPSTRHLRITCDTGTQGSWNTDAIVKFGQRVQGSRLLELRKAKVGGTGSTTQQHISGRIRSSQTGNLCVCVRLFNRGASYGASYVTTLNISATNTWQDFSITLPAFVNSTWYNLGVADGIEVGDTLIGAELWFVLKAGSYYNAAAANTWEVDALPKVSPQVQWLSTATDFFGSGTTIDIADVQWTTGTTRQVHSYDPITELSELRQFYQASSPTPGAADDAAQISQLIQGGGIIPASAIFSPQMVSAPSVTIYNSANGTANQIRWSDTTGGLLGTVNVTGVAEISQNGWANITVSGSPPTDPTNWLIQWAASAELG